MAVSRVSELAYIVAGSHELEPWRTLGSDVLGMRAVEANGNLRLSMDSRMWRFEIQPGASKPGIQRVGWRAVSEESLREIIEDLDRLDIRRETMNEADLDALGATAGVAIFIGDGFVHEVVCLPEMDGDGDPGPGFVTGDQGLGHILFEVVDVMPYDRLFLEVFGMALREDMVTAVGDYGHFYGCNPRHHSSAAVSSLSIGQRTRVMHVMVEVPTIDDVGSIFDRVSRAGIVPRTSLGRHRTDHMLSFYLPTPSEFDIEVGCEGLRVDDDSWAAVKESSRAPLWGHAGMQEMAQSK